MEAIEELAQLSESMRQAAALLADEDVDENASGSSRRASSFLNVVALGNVVSPPVHVSTSGSVFVSVSVCMCIYINILYKCLIVVFSSRKGDRIGFSMPKLVGFRLLYVKEHVFNLLLCLNSTVICTLTEL